MGWPSIAGLHVPFIPLLLSNLPADNNVDSAMISSAAFPTTARLLRFCWEVRLALPCLAFPFPPGLKPLEPLRLRLQMPLEPLQIPSKPLLTFPTLQLLRQIPLPVGPPSRIIRRQREVG